MAITSPSTASHTHAPSALGGADLRRFIELTFTLAATDFKLRYFGSVLGYLWQLVRPLLFFGVIFVFFTKILHVGRSVPHYGVYLLTGIVMWTFFVEATTGCVTSLVAREALLRKMRFPRLVIPLAVVATATFNLATNSVAVVIFAIANGVYPSWSWLEMIPILIAWVGLALGFGMALSALYVRFRDMSPIWEVVSQVVFYASPIMYPAFYYAQYEKYALLNPFALLITQMGHVFIHVYGTITAARPDGVVVHTHPFPNLHTAAHSWMTVGIGLGLIPLIFALGFWIFAHEAPRVAENL